ncbi:MAG TPA: acyl-CoA dehydrogenase [Candidatus Dormibacteraeota bacterium]|jgi:alkylation response protein AidB-like acyl-CoA dehydrogenase|nr:acyl-CoA dehydrogenase [Candidatus Dormibacteraeota bacterium]
MKLPSLKHAPAYDLEAALGNPYSDGLFGYAQRTAEDEDEQYPLDALRWLDGWGMQQHYVPLALGGMLHDFEVLLSLVRTISRRDVTVAVSHAVSFLGSAGVWIAGSENQKSGLAARLLRGQRVSLALTERDHGGDLLSYETSAHFNKEDRHLLYGEKWLINGATQNALVSVLARTEPNGGPRGFSLFLFDKQTARPGAFDCLRKVRTLGVRGSDISGIRFHHAELEQSAMIGARGEGFEVVLKGLQLSRILCAAISLGAADAAFAVTLDFALTRDVYGGTVFEIPQCRRLLVECWVDLLLCESLVTAAARSLHFVPQEASVHSAVVKYLVPRMLEHTHKQLSIVLGARYYLRDDHHSGIFQKMLRDSALISLFDGSSIVNLYSLTTQFKALYRGWEHGLTRSSNGPGLSVCNLAAPLPEFTWNGLSLTSNGQNCFIDSLHSSLAAVRSLSDSCRLSPDTSDALRQQADFLAATENALMLELGSFDSSSPHKTSAKTFDKAGDYCVLQGAAMVLQMWLANHDQAGRHLADEHLADERWLALALGRLNCCLHLETQPNEQLIHDLGERLLRRHLEKLDARPENVTVASA